MNRSELLSKRWPEWLKDFPGAFSYPSKPELGVKGFGGDGGLTIISFDPSGDRDLTREQGVRFYELLAKYGLQNAHLMDTYLVPYHEIGGREERAKEVYLDHIEAAQPDAILVMDMTSWWKRETLESGFRGGNSFAWHKLVQWLPQRYLIGDAPFDKWTLADLVVRDPTRGCLIPCYRIYHYSYMRRGSGKVRMWEERFRAVLHDLGYSARPIP
jgi:hypothetical protein